MNLPDNLSYTKEHEWAQIDGDVATIGITDYAQEQLGDIVYLELPEVDDEVAAGDTFGTVEAVKAVSDLYAPLTGTVVAVNENLENNPEVVNEDPYEKGWLLKIKISDMQEIDNLLNASEYNSFIEAS